MLSIRKLLNEVAVKQHWHIFWREGGSEGVRSSILPATSLVYGLNLHCKNKSIFREKYWRSVNRYVTFKISKTYLWHTEPTVNELGGSVECVLLIKASQTCEISVSQTFETSCQIRLLQLSHMTPMQIKQTFSVKIRIFLKCSDFMVCGVNLALVYSLNQTTMHLKVCAWFRGIIVCDHRYCCVVHVYVHFVECSLDSVWNVPF